MGRVFAAALVAGGMLVSTISTAGAATVTYAYTAKIQGIGGANDQSIFPGDTDYISGTFTYDTSWPNTDTDANEGTYTGSGGSFIANINGDNYERTGVTVLTNNGVGSSDSDFSTFEIKSTFESSALLNGSTSPYYFAMDIILVSNNGEGLPDASLPYIIPALDGWNQSNYFYLNMIQGSNSRYYQGYLTSLSPVPLPAGVWLLLSALGGLGLAGWRRKRVAA